MKTQMIKLFFIGLFLGLSSMAVATFDPATEAKLIANDGAADDEFGTSVSISGNRMAIGASNDDSGQGSVYIYDFDGTNWVQTVKLIASDAAADSFFGWSVALDGSRLLVGAVIEDSSRRGAAYVFDLNNGTWTETQKLLAADAEAADFFGSYVALDGDRLVIGAGGDDSYQGSAYVFEFDGSSWSETQKLTASGAAAGDRFGSSVTLDGNRLVVGAWLVEVGSNSNQGAAYVFDFDGSAWSESQRLTASDGAANDYLGISVSLDGNRLAVGSVGDDSFRGSAYVFDFDGSSWNETQKVVADDGESNDRFAYSVSLDGSRLAIGGRSDDIGGNSGQGSAYIYILNNGTWEQTTKLMASDGLVRDYFGWSVSLSDKYLGVGVKYADTDGNRNQGSAYIYTDDDLIFKNGFESE